MPTEREHQQRVLQAKLQELSELISVLVALGQDQTAEGVYSEQKRIASRLSRLQEGRRDE